MEEKRNVPKLRFPGFEGEWEQRKLGEILTERHILRKISNEYPRLSFTIEEGVIDPDNRKTNKRDFLMKDEANKKFLLTEVGDIIYNPANVVFGAIHRNSHGKGCLSPIYRIFETNQDSRFLECVVRSETFISKLAQRTEGSVVKLKTLKPEAFLEMNVYVSSLLEEQTKIADFFENFDKLITLHQQKLEGIKEYKKSMLQKMFAKEGEKVPEIRFPGFSGDWEQRKCKDVAPLQRGFDLPVSQMEDGDYPVVMSNGIGGYHSKYKAEGPGIVTGRSGTLGKLHYIEENYWPHNTALWVTDFKGNHPKFIYYLYQKLDLSRFGSGSGVPTLNRNDVHDAYVAIPQVEEQMNIADFLTRLDETVTLHQRKIDELKELKKGLLQQMFV